MTTFVFATHNTNKAKEINSLLPDHYEVQSLADIGFNEEIPEDKATLSENALQKANTILKSTGYSCFADDTGLEVDALGGAPGVYTARYAGPDASDTENIQKLLKALENQDNRQARFKTIIALILQDGKSYLFEGIAEGFILEQPEGSEGFGYDPIFRPRGYNRSFAEMPLSQKNKISHRQKAFSKMINFLA